MGRLSKNSLLKIQNLVEVAAALIFRNGRILITQRHRDAHLGGLWEFPGGKREPCETFKQCLKREIREELGVGISVGALFESVTHAYPEKTVRLEFFVCRLTGGEPQPIGCAALQWVTRRELGAYEFPAADACLLRKLQMTATFWKPA
ncbi:MAG TPA: 8-oxo-dGTP diphosphatase MutT [Candidatus Acidoferrum sp.]|nr:8-oxo-dGTP diphosphatase MutT [Candidatus Acidoferrum sp.]